MLQRNAFYLCGLLCLAACGSSDDDGDTGPKGLQINPGVEMVTVTGAEPGAPITLLSAEGTALLTLRAAEDGAAHFSYIPAEHVVLDAADITSAPLLGGIALRPGDGYVLRDESQDPPVDSAPFRVLEIADTPDIELYERQVLTGAVQRIFDESDDPELGFQFIEMRDGVKLSAMVRLPDPLLYGDGPYPTVVEYSGYSPSKPDSPSPGARIANLLGYATVGVNMRGSGCSGGVFDVFNPAQHADGYDIIETVARQSWVLGGRVGMVGLSYPGISQLYVASTNPPSLAAVTPLSVIADPWEMQWPGGIYNSGFTRQWLDRRDRDASVGGQDWVNERLAAGDVTCTENLELRSQNVDFERFLHGLEFRPPDADARSLPELVKRIEAPVYLTGAFQDEQTGALFADMLDRMGNSELTRFILYNGRHPDGYSPLVITRWYEFLELFVAKRVPRLLSAVREGAGAEFSREFKAEGLGFEPDRFADFADDDYDGVLAAYKAEPTVRVLFENGAGDAEQPGAPVARFERGYDTWPPPDATPTRFYLGEGGSLGTEAPTGEGADRYSHDAEAGSSTFFGPMGYQLTAALWDIDWTEFPEGKVLSYLTEPLGEDTVVTGPGYADLWIRSSVADAQVQVSVSEVRPDGFEYLVQSGWLRGGHRKLIDPDSEALRVKRSYRVEDFTPVPVGEVIPWRVYIPSVAHAFRAGSQIRITVSSPGRNHGTWEFESPDYGGELPTFDVMRSAEMPSSIVLPIGDGIAVAEGLPACPALRGQPCRSYQAKENLAAE